MVANKDLYIKHSNAHERKIAGIFKNISHAQRRTEPVRAIVIVYTSTGLLFSVTHGYNILLCTVERHH